MGYLLLSNTRARGGRGALTYLILLRKLSFFLACILLARFAPPPPSFLAVTSVLQEFILEGEVVSEV